MDYTLVLKIIGSALLLLYIDLPRFSKANGARILAVLPFFSKSHHASFQPILKALAASGHEVVAYTPYPLRQPVSNYTDVIIENVSTSNLNFSKAYETAIRTPPWKCVEMVFPLLDHLVDELLESDKIQKLLSSNEHFDVVFTEFFFGNEFLSYLGHVFKAPVIFLHPLFTNNLVNDVFGNAMSLSYVPDVCVPYSDKMTVYERTLSSLYSIVGLYYSYYQTYLVNMEYKFKKYIPDSPSIVEMLNNASLVFVNDHAVIGYAQPRTANIIPIAGIHIDEPQELFEPVKSFMDGGVDGVIFLSLGNNIPDDWNTKEYFDMYINVFRRLRQRVLWKTKKENIQGLPGNVMTVKWVPQQDVLAHPNCVLFITHCGVHSTYEAIHYRVPMVAIPYFWDQHRNGRFIVEKGIGEWLDNRYLTEENVKSAIQTVLNNPQYKYNIQRLSSIFRDRPKTPAQTVVYWTEYVLRHGASHLRPASTQLSWYQLALLDVIAVIIVLFVLIILLTYLVFRKIIFVHVSKHYVKLIKKKNN